MKKKIEHKPITVAEIIEELKKFPQDLYVHYSCQCWGPIEICGFKLAYDKYPPNEHYVEVI